MALQTDLEATDLTAAMRVQRDDRLRTNDIFDGETGRSNFAAFLLGGVVIAGGMLGFLYFDAERTNGDTAISTTSAPVEQRESSGPTIRIPARP